MPRDPDARYEVRRLCAWFDDKFHDEVTSKLLYERVNKKIMGQGYPDSQEREGRGRAGSSIIWIIMAWLLDQRRWLAGNEMTLADFTAAAHLSLSGLYQRCGLEPACGGEGLVCQDQVAARRSGRLLADQVPGFPPPAHYADLDF